MASSRNIMTTMCLAATVTMLFTADYHTAKAVSLSTERGIAGISLSLDKISFTAMDSAAGDNLVSIMSLDDGDMEPVADISAQGTGAVPESVAVPVTTDALGDDVPAAAKAEEDIPMPAKKEVKVSELSDTGVSIADSYVNIRKKADTESEVMGKLYKGCAATILETKGDWVKIKSGNVEGYIKSEYLAIGFDAEELIDKYATKWATVNTETLFVRKGKSTKTPCLTSIPGGETYEVIKESGGWVKLAVDDDEEDSIKGFVSKEYVDIKVKFEHAVSVEEERLELERAEAAAAAEREQLERLNRQQASNNSSNNSNNSSNNSNRNNSNSSHNSNRNNNNSRPSQSVGEDPSGSGTGADIARYAVKFKGNRYVYGGTSLTNGTDCSGFTQSVYRSFGKSIPRDSRSQAAGAGREVSLSSLKAGDLVFYTGGSGSVNHVALYIGGGKVVHASSPKTGIKISSVNYRTPYKARRVVN